MLAHNYPWHLGLAKPTRVKYKSQIRIFLIFINEDMSYKYMVKKNSFALTFALLLFTVKIIIDFYIEIQVSYFALCLSRS
jgi:hypothetical protein